MVIAAATCATRTAVSATSIAASRLSTDAGGEPPGAVEHHPDREADVLGVGGALEPAVADADRLGADPLEPEVGVADVEVLRPRQRGLTHPPVGKCGERASISCRVMTRGYAGNRLGGPTGPLTGVSSGAAVALLRVAQCGVLAHPRRRQYVEPGRPGLLQHPGVVVDEHHDRALGGEPAQHLDLEHTAPAGGRRGGGAAALRRGRPCRSNHRSVTWRSHSGRPER